MIFFFKPNYKFWLILILGFIVFNFMLNVDIPVSSSVPVEEVVYAEGAEPSGLYSLGEKIFPQNPNIGVGIVTLGVSYLAFKFFNKRGDKK